jgi:DNA repair protein RadA/Sms
MQNLQVALKYAGAGMAIFPCAPDKRPLVDNWLASASIDPAVIQQWWRAHPNALIGLPLKPLDLLVLDADRHGVHDGVRALQQLLAKHGELPTHPWCTTANDGEHHYFRQPEGEKVGNKKICPGLETRGFKTGNDGGYTVASGSQMLDGRRWWRGGGSPSLIESYTASAIPQAPAWLIEQLRSKQKQEQPQPRSTFRRHTNGSREGHYAAAALDSMAAELAAAPSGERNNALNSAAFRMGTMIARGWIGRAHVGDALTDACQSNGLLHDDGPDAVQGTLASGLRAGEQQPHADLEERIKNSRSNGIKRAKIDRPESDDDGNQALDSARADTVEMIAVEWIWPNRFAIGKLGIIAGLPDEGKGQILSYMAASITRGGEWPCNEGRAPRGNVIVLTAEDDLNDTVVPRLAAAGADLSRIHIIKMVRDGPNKRMFSLITDLELLRRKILAVGNVNLVQIDPISAYLGHGKVDSYRTTDVRAVLAPLVDLAAELKIAIVGILHFNKKIDVTNALLRISDSLAFGATARHVYGVVNDAEHKRKLFVRAKNNLAAGNDKALAYRFTAAVVGKDPKSGKEIWAPYILWETQYVDVTAAEAMQAAAEAKSPAARDDAKKLLGELLASGPALKSEIEEAAEANGISERTLFRAKGELGLMAKKDGANGAWRWHPAKQQKPRNWHDN